SADRARSPAPCCTRPDRRGRSTSRGRRAPRRSPQGRWRASSGSSSARNRPRAALRQRAWPLGAGAMYDFAADPAQSKPAFYRERLAAADALPAGEPDGVANMANLAALVWQLVADLNWAGFYRLLGEELVLGPFCGKPACIRIPLGRGVCGTAA